MPGDAVVGKDCYLYYSATGGDTPDWEEIADAMDVNLPLTKGEADVSTRASDWKRFAGALKETGIEFDYLHQRGEDDVFAALLDSYLNDTHLEMLILDGPVEIDGTADADSQGLRCWMEVFDLSHSQALEEGTKHSVVMKPVRHLDGESAIVEPSWYPPEEA